MSEEEVETYFVFGQMDEESMGGWVELWSGSYAQCVDYVNSPQAQLDVEMGLYLSIHILDEEWKQALLEMAGIDGQTIH